MTSSLQTFSLVFQISNKFIYEFSDAVNLEHLLFWLNLREFLFCPIHVITSMVFFVKKNLPRAFFFGNQDPSCIEAKNLTSKQASMLLIRASYKNGYLTYYVDELLFLFVSLFFFSRIQSVAKLTYEGLNNILLDQEFLQDNELLSAISS